MAGENILAQEIIEDFMSLGISMTELHTMCAAKEYVSYATFRNALKSQPISEASVTWIVMIHSHMFRPNVDDEAVDLAMEAMRNELRKHWPKKRNGTPKMISNGRLKVLVLQWLERQR